MMFRRYSTVPAIGTWRQTAEIIISEAQDLTLCTKYDFSGDPKYRPAFRIFSWTHKLPRKFNYSGGTA